MKYFALSYNGNLHYVGEFQDWGDAEIRLSDMSIDPIWVFNENEAKSFASFINNELELKA